MKILRKYFGNICKIIFSVKNFKEIIVLLEETFWQWVWGIFLENNENKFKMFRDSRTNVHWSIYFFVGDNYDFFVIFMWVF